MGNCQSHEWTSGILDRRGGHTTIRFRQNVKKNKQTKTTQKIDKMLEGAPGRQWSDLLEKAQIKKKTL